VCLPFTAPFHAPLDRIQRAQHVQRDLHNWIPLLNFFDDYLSEHVSKRTELTLTTFEGVDEHSAVPFRNVLAILRVTTVLLRYCSQKQIYNSLEVSSPQLRPECML
jgi:hypothetical protein